MITISQLKYMLALHRYGHFGEAARACEVSQPTLSAQVRKAEEEFGIEVFVRGTKPISISERGAAVIEQAQIVVAAHERMLRLAQGNFEQLAGELHLAVIPTLAPYVLPWFLSSFAQQHPLVRLTVTEQTTNEILDKLRQGTVDVGLLATPLGDRRIRERALFEDPFYLYAATSEPLLECNEIVAEQLEPEKIWLLEEGHCVRHQTLSLCDSAVNTRPLATVSFEAGSFETLCNLIDASGGYTIIPETYARQLPRSRRQAQVRAFDGVTPTREIGLAHLRNTWKPDLIAALERSISENLPRPFQQATGASMVLPVHEPMPCPREP